MAGFNTMQVIVVLVVSILIIAIAWYSIKRIIRWFSRRKSKSSQTYEL